MPWLEGTDANSDCSPVLGSRLCAAASERWLTSSSLAPRSYKLAENIDAQLKRMAQDLKDIIEHLNTSGRPADTSDPVNANCFCALAWRPRL